jgi:dUTP pyrophosphatase
MAYKLQTVVANGVGTIDADYRGEIGVLLWNRNTTPVEIIKGSKIAQFVIGKVFDADFIEVEEISNTIRGQGGFGSTGR